MSPDVVTVAVVARTGLVCIGAARPSGAPTLPQVLVGVQDVVMSTQHGGC